MTNSTDGGSGSSPRAELLQDAEAEWARAQEEYQAALETAEERYVTKEGARVQIDQEALRAAARARLAEEEREYRQRLAEADRADSGTGGGSAGAERVLRRHQHEGSVTGRGVDEP